MRLDLGHFEVGGSDSARTEHPNREVVLSRPCVRSRSVMHAESVIKRGLGSLPFPPLSAGGLPFSFRIGLLELA